MATAAGTWRSSRASSRSASAPVCTSARPGSSGLHHLVWEVVDNSVDEAMAGYCNRIDVTLLADGGCRVVDNGRGIPTDINPQQKMSGVEIALTKLHGGGKFGGQGYKVSGGLHGVGVSVVNALSTRLIVEVDRDGQHYRMEFADGGKARRPSWRWPARRPGRARARRSPSGRTAGSSRRSSSGPRPSSSGCRCTPS